MTPTCTKRSRVPIKSPLNCNSLIASEMIVIALTSDCLDDEDERAALLTTERSGSPGWLAIEERKAAASAAVTEMEIRSVIVIERVELKDSKVDN